MIQTLTDKVGIRAIQWGKSMTDKDRELALRQITESFYDLSEVLEVDVEDLSLGGKLALGVGSRGKPGCNAHYEPSNKIISIQRNKHGSLAHELFHAIDHQAGEKNGKNNLLTNYSERTIEDPEYKEIVTSLHKEMNIFKSRMVTTQTYKNLSWKEKTYFSSPIEMFARIGETMVSRELEKNGRENTYLSGGQHEHLYPNQKELESLTPLIKKMVKMTIQNQTKIETKLTA